MHRDPSPASKFKSGLGRVGIRYLLSNDGESVVRSVTDWDLKRSVTSDEVFSSSISWVVMVARMSGKVRILRFRGFHPRSDIAVLFLLVRANDLSHALFTRGIIS